jgi:Putative adhesin
MSNVTDLDQRTDQRSTSDPALSGRDPGSRAARIVWITLGGILALAALAWGTYSVISVLAHEEHTQRSTFSSDDVAALQVSNESGSVTITATPGDTVTVVAEVSDGWQTTDMSMQVVDGVLELNTDCPAFVSPWCNVDYTVSIPADRPVTVDGSGIVRVRGMSAPIDIDSDDGRLELDDISGDIRVSNDDGRIVGRRLTASSVDARNTNGRIELSFLEPPQSVSASTENGSIEVVVPDSEVLYRVEMDTGNGGTDNLVRTDPNSDHVIDLSTDNGSITVRPPG